jgi:antitoxin HigA-1
MPSKYKPDTSVPGNGHCSMPLNGLPPIHPGEVLKAQFLHPMGLSVCRVATAINVSKDNLQQVINGRQPLTLEMGKLLAGYFGTDPHLWNRLQQEFDQESSASSQ